MRFTYRTLGKLIALMNDDQLDCDVTVEDGIEDECYPAELRIAGSEHSGGLDDGHPVLYISHEDDGSARRNDVANIAIDIGLLPENLEWRTTDPPLKREIWVRDSKGNELKATRISESVWVRGKWDTLCSIDIDDSAQWRLIGTPLEEEVLKQAKETAVFAPNLE